MILLKEKFRRHENLSFSVDLLFDLLKAIKLDRWSNTGIDPLDAPYEGYSEELFDKLLSGVLGRWENVNGFDIYGFFGNVLSADILFGNPTNLFQDQLDNSKPFKDLGAGPKHGEYTHRIQWYLLGKGLDLKNSGGLYKDVKRWISRDQLDALSRNSGDKKRRYLWEYLFDRDGVPSNASSVAFLAQKDDFRGPSNLNQYLMRKDVGKIYPLLHLCLTDRYLKREKFPYDIDYALKKISDNAELLKIRQALRNIQGKGATSEDIAQISRLTKGGFIRRGTFSKSIAWQDTVKKKT